MGLRLYSARYLRGLAVVTFFSGIFLLASILIGSPQKANAGTISSIGVSVADATKSATTTYTVTLKNASKLPQGTGIINVQIYGSYWDYNFNNATVASGTSPASFGIYNRWYNGFSVYATADVAANTSVTLKIGNVVNPSKGGYYFAHVWTSTYSTALDGTGDWNGDYSSAYFEIGTNTNVKGTITDSNGVGVPYATVYLYSGGYTNYYYAYTDVNGTYGIADVVADSYTFYMYGPYTTTGKSYFPPDNSTITVTSGLTTTKNASFLAATKTLSGKITKTSSTGAAVTDATVSIWKVGGNGYASATTDSSGNYSFTLTGGTWSYSIWPKNWPSTWTYSNSYETLSFVNDSSVESQTKNLVVDVLSSTVVGSIQKSDGTVPSQYSAGISLNNTKNQWFSVQMASDSSFTANVTPGTYTVSGYVSDTTQSFPKVENFTVGDGETKNLGVIKLIEKADNINITVKDNLGGAVASAWVSSWRNDGTYDWSSCQTATDGTCNLKVTPGIWQVSAWPQWKEGGYDYISSGQPTSVTVTSKVTATKTFTFQKATSTISGKVVDPNGNIISTLNSWASANDGSQSWSNIGASVTSGTFTLKVPAGIWDVNVYIYQNDYIAGDPVTVTIGNNESKSVTLTTLKNNSTISGTIYFDKVDAANKVTGKWMSIYATKGKNSTWQSATLNQENATYLIKVAQGRWNLGFWIDSSLGYSSGNGQDVTIDIGSNETKTYDIILKKADSTISGKATKSDGNAMQWAWITADTRDSGQRTDSMMNYTKLGASSNTSGNYSMKVPAGTYWISANMWVGSGYINPKRQKVTVDASHPATADLVFRLADATISGNATIGSNGTNAFISAYSEDGGYSDTNANNQGTYQLSVSSGTKWHVTGVKESGNDIYKSVESIVDLNNVKSSTANLVLEKQTYTLPKAFTLSFNPSKQQSITLDDGTTITAPANSISTSATTVTFTAQPTATLAQQNNAKPLAYGYAFSITDQNGTAITKFNSNITIETKYQDGWISSSKGVNESDLNLAYYDEPTDSWKELTNCTISTEQNTVTCQVDHFTTFAIVSPSDTTPAAAPTGVSATVGDTKVTLSWTNPTDTDFSAVNIYRSTTSGQTGSKVQSAISGTSKEDTGLTNGTTYYYTVRSLDKSSNESTNTDQVSAQPTSSSLPKTGMDRSPWIVLLNWLISIF